VIRQSVANESKQTVIRSLDWWCQSRSIESCCQTVAAAYTSVPPPKWPILCRVGR